QAAMLDDARVVAGCEPRRACPAGEPQEPGEPEAAVAAGARIGRITARVALDEASDDGAAELLAQVERHVREPEAVARFARGDHGLRRAARALGARPVRVEPEPQRDPDRVRAGTEQRDGAVDPAA